MDFIEDLKWRGILNDITPGCEDLLAKNKIAGYIGFDPTADSLHIGSLAQIMLLARFALAGHKAIALIGEATVQFGDPTGRQTGRTFIERGQLAENAFAIGVQIERIFNAAVGTVVHAPRKLRIVNNMDWLGDKNLLQFMVTNGVHFPVSQMMARDSMKDRVNNGLTLTELCYQMLQAYDFYHLSMQLVQLQMGGSDQWGNITAGTDFCRRKGGPAVHGLTIPLVTRQDGTKFGKSDGDNIWLDPNKTSAYKFFQFWLNIPDEAVSVSFKVFTMLNEPGLEAVQQQTIIAQKRVLARMLTKLVHSEEDSSRINFLTVALFTSNDVASILSSYNEEETDALFKGVPTYECTNDFVDAKDTGIDQLLSSSIRDLSRSECQRLIDQRGVTVNGKTVLTYNEHYGTDQFIGKYLLIRIGKKGHKLLKLK